MLDFEALAKGITAEWKVISSVPINFIVSQVVLIAVVFTVLSAWFRKRIADKSSTIDTLNHKLASYENKKELNLTPEPQSGKLDGHENSRNNLALLTHNIAAAGHGGGMPEFRACFATSGRDVRFYVEFSQFFPNVMGVPGWTQPTVILYLECDRFTKGESVRFPILRSCQTRDGIRFQFGEEILENGYPKCLVGPEVWHRGRVTALSTHDVAEYTYFIVVPPTSADAMPLLIGEHIFSGMKEFGGP